MRLAGKVGRVFVLNSLSDKCLGGGGGEDACSHVDVNVCVCACMRVDKKQK